MYKLYTHSKYPYVQIISIPFTSISKIDFALCNQPTETPDKYYKRQSVKPDIITNGGFFNTSDGATCFGFKDEGNIINRNYKEGIGIIRNKELIFSNSQNKEGVRDFVEGYPVLVKEGLPISINYATEINYNARRTCIGWNSTHYFIVVVDKPGLKFKALQEIFLELGATYAINLDGGGSTRLLVEGKRKTAEVYARPVDNVMCVYLNKPKPVKVYYRVQVGAFSKKTNAEKLREELVAKGFTEAYVKKIGLYYKVQLGAFSVKLNAERLKDRVIAAGYKAFITTK